MLTVCIVAMKLHFHTANAFFYFLSMFCFYCIMFFNSVQHPAIKIWGGDSLPNAEFPIN